jgi:plasmid stabilization system protein ParE
MRVVYSPRAIRDLEHLAAYYRAVADPKIAAAISERIDQVVNRVARRPQSAPRVAGRPGIHAVLLRRYPYKIFYRLRGDAVEILHIRHTARQPWTDESK